MRSCRGRGLTSRPYITSNKYNTIKVTINLYESITLLIYLFFPVGHTLPFGQAHSDKMSLYNIEDYQIEINEYSNSRWR